MDLTETESEVDAEAQIDKAEELRVKWGVETGQLWQLGEHRLICGDCTDKAVVERVMGENSISLVVTSPPYDNGESYEKGANREDWQNLINGMIRESTNCLMDGGYFSINMGNRVGFNNIGYCGNVLENNDLTFLRRVVWKKPDGAGIPSHGHTHKNPIGLNWHPMMITEDILIYYKNNRREPVKSELFDTDLFRDYYTDCWQFSGVVSDKKQGHPAAFPELLPKLLISFLSISNDIIYEPFNGSGTTLIACERLGRKCRAVEISPAYVAVAIQRWVDVTGKEPVLI
jgi:DNA modification methylase